ncbi:3-oxoacyl-[acyl-carrier-protein] reductase [Flammeovirga kamogawensis]|uniref:3-oxoacyl-[acyl-carrier-protein] reductase n=1 Tax=Flammeovirga kamogawensis TaxID=373891 RepID=A0ABX8GQB3_9BACT|nr:3-oxoacyl-[acyl-carrier-protein] reductase [Flammeovirga kamogawensis]MBB6463443.1 3-oxoacyl-[acyl-carrier protein] reductase [Flammeovirga kamogawensis]QWG05631.1 3-oxoacyl-[acyl-carrier-protein] reductase [Flammeovirga kamogawensis]TRX67462.1 3-oxoacyl-[acyl-carrier-protein] reductase [Flammeovirga kamogawensis]
MKLLEGKNVLITGASKGIGRSIAIRCAEHGANIGFTYLSSVEKGEALVAELEALGIKAKGYRSDASKMEAAEKLVKDFTTDFGALDALINNAGITRDTLLMRMTEDQFNEVIRVNLNSVFNMTKAATKTFLKQRSGSIINMSSVVGVYGNAGQANYAASKAGIIGFTQSVAKELAPRNIRCNAVAPGFIETEMTATLDQKVKDVWLADIPMKRGGKPEEVADLCVFLASDMSTYITRQTIQLTGAMKS